MPNKPLAARAGLVLAGLVLAGAFANGALAEPAAYPHKVVTLVTHSSPGGGSDVFLREMSKHLGKYINATFVVENVQGGSGARAMARLATAKPDGSVFYATTPTYIYTSLLSKPANTYRDLEPLVNVFTDAEVVYTRVDGPFQIAEGRHRPRQGQARTLGRRQPGFARAPGGGAAEAASRRQRGGRLARGRRRHDDQRAQRHARYRHRRGAGDPLAARGQARSACWRPSTPSACPTSRTCRR